MVDSEQFDGLEEKLEFLEEMNVFFRAGYLGKGEVITAVMPDGSFMDWHWLEENDDGDVQRFDPAEFPRMVDEVIEELDSDWQDEKIRDRAEELGEKYD